MGSSEIYDLPRDLIDIPDHVQMGNFVLKLLEDIQRPEAVLDNCVVTDELVRCYDAALALIRGAVQGRTSKATFLHGSLGSGKSHFMAARFDNPRAPQIRLPAFNLDRLCQVGCKVRDIFHQEAQAPDRIGAYCSDDYVRDLANGVAGKLGGKVGVAPRIFLKKLVADVLDRVDQFADFDPRRNYALTIVDNELTPIERQAAGATDVDEIELDV